MKEKIDELIRCAKASIDVQRGDGYFPVRQLEKFYKRLQKSQREEFWNVGIDYLLTNDENWIEYVYLPFSLNEMSEEFLVALENFLQTQRDHLPPVNQDIIIIVLNRFNRPGAAELALERLKLQRSSGLKNSLFYSNRQYFLDESLKEWNYLHRVSWTPSADYAYGLLLLYDSPQEIKDEMLNHFLKKNPPAGQRFKLYLDEFLPKAIEWHSQP